MHQRRKMILLLYAECGAGDVDVIGSQQIHGVILSALLKSCLHAEDFA